MISNRPGENFSGITKELFGAGPWARRHLSPLFERHAEIGKPGRNFTHPLLGKWGLQKEEITMSAAKPKESPDLGATFSGHVERV
jgi:hypothetical protein